MAMTMKEHHARKRGRVEPRRVVFQEFAEKKGLLAQTNSAWIGGKKIRQFIAKDRSATRLQDDYRHTTVNLLAQQLHHVHQVLLGSIHHAEVIQGASAA